MAYIKLSSIQQELEQRGYPVKATFVIGQMGHEFLEFSNDVESFCVGPFEGFDTDGDTIVDTANLWVCRKNDLEKNIFRNDKALPVTDDIFVITNSLEAWVMRDSLFNHAIPV